MNTTDPTSFDLKKTHAGQSFKHDSILTRARFTPDGNQAIATGVDGVLHVWRIEDGTKQTLGRHDTWICSLICDGKTNRAYSGDAHGNIKAWDIAQPDKPPVLTIANADSGWVRSLAVTADGKLLLSAGDDGVVREWDTTTGKRTREFTGHKGDIHVIALHPDGRSFVSGDIFGIIKQWDMTTGKFVRDLDAGVLHTRKEEFIADVCGVRSIAFNADGTLLACGGIIDAETNTFCPGKPRVLVFDWSSGKLKSTLEFAAKSDGPINGLRFLKDGTLTGYGENMNAKTVLAFWKMDQAEAFHTLPGESAYDLDLHPDGVRLLAPTFVSNGSGGNGAREKQKAKYIPNGALVQVLNMFEKKAEPKPAKK